MRPWLHSLFRWEVVRCLIKSYTCLRTFEEPSNLLIITFIYNISGPCLALDRFNIPLGIFFWFYYYHSCFGLVVMLSRSLVDDYIYPPFKYSSA